VRGGKARPLTAALSGDYPLSGQSLPQSLLPKESHPPPALRKV
jgi:hypothetical protein